MKKSLQEIMKNKKVKNIIEEAQVWAIGLGGLAALGGILKLATLGDDSVERIYNANYKGIETTVWEYESGAHYFNAEARDTLGYGNISRAHDWDGDLSFETYQVNALPESFIKQYANPDSITMLAKYTLAHGTVEDY